MLNPLVATADQHPNLSQLLPDLLQSLCERFRIVECEFVLCPNLHEPPYRTPSSTAAFLSGDISLVTPSTSCPDFGKEIVCQLDEGTVITKAASSPVQVIRIHLESGDDWKSPIRDLLNSSTNSAPSKWSLLCVEARSDSQFAHFHLLRSESIPSESPIKNSTILIVPMKPEPVEAAAPLVSSVKKMASLFTGSAKPAETDPSGLKKPTKLVRKVAKTTSPTISTADEKTEQKTVKKSLISTKTVKAANGTKIVKKRIVQKGSPKENTPELVQEVREEIANVSYVVKLGASPAPDGLSNSDPLPSSPEEEKTSDEVSTEGKTSENGSCDVNGAEEPPKEEENASVEFKSNGEEKVEIAKLEINEEEALKLEENVVPLFSVPSELPTEDECPRPTNEVTAEPCATMNGTNGNHFGRTLSYEDNSSTSTIIDASRTRSDSVTITSASIAARLASIRNRESSAESGEGTKTMSRSSGFGTGNGVRSQLSNDVESDLSINEDSHSSGFSEVLKVHKASPTIDHSLNFMMRSPHHMPIIVLQKVLKCMSFEDLGKLRQVTPIWDEMCGQMLNGGYYDLTAQADRLLTECQRRVHKEGYLSKPIQVLTNLQVHVINPIDVMRVAMDEGVCCFPYGKILDKAFEVLEKVKEAIRMKEDFDFTIRWEHVAELSRRAQVHYKVFVEGLIEDRMGEVLNLKAQQRIQRLDSFMIESTVTKLERVATQAKDDLHWEMEQLKSQNTQLRKDNRDIKRDYLKLEARVETLERKFKTVARLLQ